MYVPMYDPYLYLESSWIAYTEEENGNLIYFDLNNPITQDLELVILYQYVYTMLIMHIDDEVRYIYYYGLHESFLVNLESTIYNDYGVIQTIKYLIWMVLKYLKKLSLKTSIMNLQWLLNSFMC